MRSRVTPAMPFVQFFGFSLLLALSPQLAVGQITTRGFVTDLKSPQDRFIAADLNGDGKADMIYYRPGGGYAGAYLSHGDGTFRYIGYTNAGGGENGFPGDLSSTADTFIALDLNGDGKSDFIQYRPGSGYAIECLSNGDGSVNCFNLSSPGSQAYGFQDDMLSGDERFVAADLNRDGRQDFIVYSARSHTARAYLSPATGHQLTTLALVNQGVPNASLGFRDTLQNPDETIVALDMNGDGASDLLVLANGNSGSQASLSAYFNNGLGVFTWVPYARGSSDANGFSGNAGHTSSRIVPLDLNGDGKADFLFIESGTGNLKAFLSKGDGTVTSVTYLSNNSLANGFTSPDPSTSDTAIALDLNGDGKSDFIWYTPGYGEMSAYVSNASGNGSVTRTVYYSGATAQNGFSDAVSNPADTALALNFLGQQASGFVWYTPGQGLFQGYSPAYSGAGVTYAGVQYYGFYAYPGSFLNDLYWSLANVPLKAISMPGTHDSAMYNLNLGEGDDSETQLSDLTGQLNAGARVLDFRFGYYLIENGAIWRIDGEGDLGGRFATICDTGAITSEGFYMYGHSDVCTNRSVLSELNEIETWLQQNPGEVVILDMDGITESGGFVYDYRYPWPANVNSQFVQLLKQTEAPDLIYTQQAACGVPDSVPSVQCSIQSNLPQNATLAKLRSLNKRLILLDINNYFNYSGLTWKSTSVEVGYCETGNVTGNTQPLDELACLDTIANGGFAKNRPSFQPGYQAPSFVKAEAELTPFGAGGGAESPIVFAYGDPFIKPSPFNPFLGSEIESGHWATNALNLWLIDALGVGTFNLAGLPTSYGPLVNDMIAVNNQTFLPAGQFTAAVVGVGKNGDVWAVPASHALSVFKLNQATNVWNSLISGQSNVKKLAVDSKGGVYILHTAGYVAHFDQNGQSEKVLLTACSDIAIGSDDALWGISMGSDELTQLVVTGPPPAIPTTYGVRVAVDNTGTPWVLQADGTIVNTLKGTVGNMKAKEIAISADGSAFIVGLSQGPSLFRYNPSSGPSTGTFSPFIMDAKEVATDGSGHPWAISNSSGLVYRGALDQK